MGNAEAIVEFIDVCEPCEVQRWADCFDVTEDELRRAVEKVGCAVPDVRRELSRHLPTRRVNPA